MPIYEYECKSCGTRFDKMQPITAEPLTECLNCGKGPVKRVLQPVGVIFKGSGWYINDSRNSAKPKEAAGSADTDGKDAKPDASSEGKAESSGTDAQAKESKESPAPSASTE